MPCSLLPGGWPPDSSVLGLAPAASGGDGDLNVGERRKAALAMSRHLLQCYSSTLPHGASAEGLDDSQEEVEDCAEVRVLTTAETWPCVWGGARAMF